ncbi:MAG: hypothetical protein IKH26_11495 [Bacteroidaceae bacterium]|nr:hypothetical protein [Bacteroidaceae bacterium]
MNAKRTSGFTSLALLSSLILLLSVELHAQEPGERPKPTLYVVDSLNVEQKQTFFQGFTLSGDLFGLIQKYTSDYGVFEGALRVNFKNKYFPIVEAGYAICETTNEDTHISYETKAPYLRAGLDINMLKNKWQNNRLYLGARYGISKFNYDISGPEQTDKIWGVSQPFHFKDISTTAHWIEFIAGVQVKIWGNFHMGWSVRFKTAISKGSTDYGTPYYIPGYGTTTSGTCWGATYNLSFDLNWGRKKNKTMLNAVVHPVSPQSPPKQHRVEDEQTEEETE